MFFRTLKRSFWLLYDNLFKCVLMNFVVFLIMLGFFALFFMKDQNIPFTALSVGLVWHLFAPAYMHYLSKLARTQETGGFFAEIAAGFGKFALRGAAIFLLNSFFIYIAVLCVNFYRTKSGGGIPMLVLGGLGIWIVIVFFIMQIYVMPIMVMDEKKRIFVSYKKALLMTMSSPFSSSTTAFFIGYLLLMLYPMMGFAFRPVMPTVVALFALFPIFLMPFLSFVFIMIMQVNASVLVYEKHNVYPPLKEFWEERSFGSIFRPWEHR